MCDQVTKSKVGAVVNDFVSKGYMFTAWDITKFLRKNDRVSHRDVQDAVREIWNSGSMTDYTRDTKDVGAPVAPFVYYHQNADVNDYQTDWMDNNPTQNGMKNDGVVSTIPSGTVTNPSAPVVPLTLGGTSLSSNPLALNGPVRSTSTTVVTKSVTSEGRLNIPIKMVQASGFPKGAVVVATVENGSIVIENKRNLVNTEPVFVNYDSRARISRTLLDCISSGDTFRIERNGAKILVNPA